MVVYPPNDEDAVPKYMATPFQNSKLDADPDGLRRKCKARMFGLFSAGLAEEVPAGDPLLWMIPRFPAFHPFRYGLRVVLTALLLPMESALTVLLSAAQTLLLC